MDCFTNEFGQISFNNLYTLGKEMVVTTPELGDVVDGNISDFLAVDENRMDIIKSKPAHRFSPSSLSSCRRMVYFKYCKYKRDRVVGLTGDKWIRFKLGSMAHAMTQALIALGCTTAGYSCKIEGLVSVEPIFGFLDLAVTADGQRVVGEIKSSTSDKMSKMFEPYEKVMFGFRDL